METQAMETAAQPSQAIPAGTTAETQPASVTPQAVTAAACSSCAANQAGAQPAVQPLPPPCIYVIGHIEPRFPRLSVEKEAHQATQRVGASKDTDREVMKKVLSDPKNKYLVRQLCWVLSVQGIETYILIPRDGDYQPLIDAYRAEPNPGDIELVIGVRGPIANPDMCNGLMVPIVIFDQIYDFDRKSLLDGIRKPKDPDPNFAKAAGEMFDHLVQQSDNAGATDADRALNYLAVRYEGPYHLAAQQFASNASFTAIDVAPSRLSGTRKIVDVVFSFTDRATDVVSKSFTRVDVTECFPFLVTKMSPYYDR